jgi:hypothetical protein
VLLASWILLDPQSVRHRTSVDDLPAVGTYLDLLQVLDVVTRRVVPKLIHSCASALHDGIVLHPLLATKSDVESRVECPRGLLPSEKQPPVHDRGTSRGTSMSRSHVTSEGRSATATRVLA